ncbi:unnamed protein product [Coffea canephora]|uniref:DH200=94 genomic scaffold, scaffold_10947 n=1 Tax=Coffea canephora TaxID=49390 RepID=A0A068VQZ6_COFCA|nr:unnamed protein product [Coffea canephora]
MRARIGSDTLLLIPIQSFVLLFCRITKKLFIYSTCPVAQWRSWLFFSWSRSIDGTWANFF